MHLTLKVYPEEGSNGAPAREPRNPGLDIVYAREQRGGQAPFEGARILERPYLANVSKEFAQLAAKAR